MERKLHKRSACVGWMLLAFLLLGVTEGQPVKASSAQPPVHQVTLFVLDDLSYKDYRTLAPPALTEAAAFGATGLLRIPPEKTDPAQTYLTLSSGRPFSLTSSLTFAQIGEKVDGVPAEAMFTWTRGVPPFPGALFSLQAPSLFAGHQIENLGTLLHEQGRQTAAILPALPVGEIPQERLAGILAMDAQGLIDGGASGPALLRLDPTAPFGVWSDSRAVMDTWKTMKHASLIVVDPGDLFRAEHMPGLAESQRAALKRAALSHEDALFEQIRRQLGPGQVLIAFSPQVSAVSNQPDPLAPMIAVGGPFSGGTLLTSATTHRIGLVTSIDLAPTLAHLLGLNGLHAAGDAIETSTVPSGKTGVAFLDRFHHQMITVYNERPAVLVGFFVLLALAFVFVVWGRRRHRYVLPVLLGIGAAPASFFLLPLAGTFGAVETLLLFLGVDVLLAGVLSRFPRPWALLGLGLLTWLPVVVDALLGGPLAHRSILSYDPIAGGRYYGIGNEYMGVLIGSLLLVFAALPSLEILPQRWQRDMAVLLMAGTTFLLGWPTLGANAGGTLTAAVAFAAAAWGLWRRYSLWTVVSLLGAFCIGLAFVTLSAFWATAPTHVTRASQEVAGGQWAAVITLVWSKIGLYLATVGTAGLGWLVLLFVAGMTAAVLWPVLRRHGNASWSQSMEVGMTIGAIGALLFNDTGITAAGFILLYWLVAVLSRPNLPFFGRQLWMWIHALWKPAGEVEAL
ncbi:MAG: hypothetical protein IMW91_01480 [Firmicutes bacterium]|nr:hypothetical protein [Bacillota bacterium]